MEITAGPLLIKQRKKGDRIVILHLTLGEGGNPKMSPAAYGAQPSPYGQGPSPFAPQPQQPAAFGPGAAGTPGNCL